MGSEVHTGLEASIGLEVFMGLEAHVSPSGLGRCGGPIGGLIRLLMPIPMPTHRSSPRPPPRSMSNPHRRLLSNLPRPSPSGITVTIRVATTRMCSSALADGDRLPQRRHRWRTLEAPLPLFPERCWRCCTPGNSSRLAVPLDQPGSREFRIVGDDSQDVLMIAQAREFFLGARRYPGEGP
jgi:hypothetical protein